MLFIIELLLALHFAILFGLISYEQVWAGSLQTKEEMFRFETVSILINLFMLIVLFVKRRLVKKQLKNRVVDYLLKACGVFFALNTLGNLFAESKVELILGSAVTLTLSVLFFVISSRRYE